MFCFVLVWFFAGSYGYGTEKKNFCQFMLKFSSYHYKMPYFRFLRGMGVTIIEQESNKTTRWLNEDISKRGRGNTTMKKDEGAYGLNSVKRDHQSDILMLLQFDTNCSKWPYTHFTCSKKRMLLKEITKMELLNRWYFRLLTRPWHVLPSGTMFII